MYKDRIRKIKYMVDIRLYKKWFPEFSPLEYGNLIEGDFTNEVKYVDIKEQKLIEVLSNSMFIKYLNAYKLFHMYGIVDWNKNGAYGTGGDK
jgi:hypothetical protein